MKITSNSSSPLSIDAFQQAASTGTEIQVSEQDGQLKLLGTGETPSRRQVAWVEGSQQGNDAAALFLQTLLGSYGNRIGQAVARELGLDTQAGKPLTSRQVNLAIDMAATSQTAFSGMNFLSRTAISASANNAEFRAACGEAGVSAQSMDSDARKAIDLVFAKAFNAAADGDRNHIDLPTARSLMRDAITQVASMNQQEVLNLISGS